LLEGIATGYSHNENILASGFPEKGIYATSPGIAQPLTRTVFARVNTDLIGERQTGQGSQADLTILPYTSPPGHAPNGELTSCIDPALHGVCGFCYSDDSSVLNEPDCQLRVETKDGELRYRLANSRLSRDGKVMNKFHFNIPASASPAKSRSSPATQFSTKKHHSIHRPTANDRQRHCRPKLAMDASRMMTDQTTASASN
jgi:hypothetical protein